MLDSDLPPVRSHDAPPEPWLLERYRLVAKATNDAIWDWNLATDQVEWNDGVYTLFGYGRDEVSPTAGWWYETIHPDDRDRVVQGIHLAQDRGEPVWFDEYRFRRADGTYAWVTDRGYCVFDGSGRPQRMVGAMHDQSERRRQEEALKEANGRLSAQADELRAANEALCDNAAELESQQEELQAAHEELAELYERLRRHNEAVEAEVQQRTAEVGRYSDAWRELAEGYAASATGDAFFKSLATFLARALGVDYVLIGTLLPPQADRVRTIALCARGQIAENMEYDLSGTPCENVVSRSMCVYPKDIQALFPEDQEAVDLGLDSYVGTPLFDTEGACLGLIAVMHTTPLASTEAAEALLRIVAKRAEAEMQRLRAEERIARHLEELAEANRRLQEADRYKDEFLSVISHELRTPLNFITGFASTLDDEVQGPLNERQHDAMGKILNGAERMLMLIDDLLDFARMRAGRFDITPAPTDYRAVVEEVLMTMAPTAEQKGIRLSAAIDVPACLQIDGRRLSQVLSNLVGNGLKFTPAGGQVMVRAAVRQGRLETEVADTGQGIAPDDLAKVFNRFEQLDMSNARAAGGVGLGLAIAQTIVEAHGGTIAAESRLKHGSTFRFTVPLTPSARPHAALEESAP